MPRLYGEVIKDIYQAVLKRTDVTPGVIVTVQTFGELAHWHPHVHAIVTDGVFTADGGFIPLLEMAVEPFLELWEKKVFDLLLGRNKISEDIVNQMRHWQHLGFSVHKNVVIAEGDSKGLENLIQYIGRCPFSLSRMIKVTESGQVIYKTEHGDCQKFPDPASDTLKSGIARNFHTASSDYYSPLRGVDPLDFLAEITQHIPEPRAHTINYFGWYSNKSRGMRAKQKIDPVVKEYLVIHDDDTPHRKLCRDRWATLIKKGLSLSLSG